MNQKIKIGIVTVSVAVVSVAIIAILYNTELVPAIRGLIFWGLPMSQNTIEKDFHQNKALIQTVTNYLVECEYSSILINGMDDTMSVGEDGRIKIDDKDTQRIIKQLFIRGYNAIDKKDNCISFVRWSNMDVGRGVVYSIDGHIPNESSLQYLTRLEPLSDDGWYYYEEDFNEYRRRRQADQK